MLKPALPRLAVGLRAQAGFATVSGRTQVPGRFYHGYRSDSGPRPALPRLAVGLGIQAGFATVRKVRVRVRVKIEKLDPQQLHTV